jgi:hypothetical protein
MHSKKCPEIINALGIISDNSRKEEGDDYSENRIHKSTMRSKIKKIEMAMINTLQLAARKNLIQMSLQW